MERTEIRQILLDAWAGLMPATEDDVWMDYWVWEWIQKYWPVEPGVLDMTPDSYNE